MSKIFIGVDPAFRKNGFCMCIIDENKEVRFITFKLFIHFISWVLNEMPNNAYVAIENSNLQNATFDMRGNKLEIASKSRSVGKNQAISEIAYQLLKEYAIKVNNISPKRKGAKIKFNSYIQGMMASKGLKCGKKEFSQDERDAFQLAMMA